MADPRRITVEDVRAALAELPGFRLMPQVTYDPECKLCCPIGALAAVADARYRAGVIEAEQEWNILGLDDQYSGGFMTGFDGEPTPLYFNEGYDGNSWAERGRAGYADGRAVREAFGVVGGLAS